ncbi:hypothetical protein DM558_03965 [Entomomonas moraniae]|uniref:Uncharacterized protein n=1 Tax=Entomomonas moraniae TaxID=2213226 RepID=A0A3Q9JKM7_9GAMM|nr:hypothetical protein DM558_03965 [Entomomonas moraniae]
MIVKLLITVLIISYLAGCTNKQVVTEVKIVYIKLPVIMHVNGTQSKNASLRQTVSYLNVR